MWKSKMTEKEKAKRFLKSRHEVIFRTKELTDAGFHRTVVKELLEDGFVVQLDRGIYVITHLVDDDFAILQKKYRKGIFSMDVALYLLHQSPYCPHKYTMTFPKGYNNASFKNEKLLKVKWTSENYYSLGLTQIESPCGDMINIYDLERTICDMVREANNNVEYLVPALRDYFQSDKKDIKKLLFYARELHVTNKIIKCMEIFS